MKTLIIILILLPAWAYSQRNTRLPKPDFEFYRNNNYRNVCVKSNPKTTCFKLKNSKLVKYQKKRDYKLLRTKQNHCNDKAEVNRMKIRDQSKRWWPNHSKSI